MAEATKTNWLTDIALPAFAFLASASGPYGAAASQGLLGALTVGERRRENQREDARLSEVLRQRDEQQSFEREQARAKSAREKEEAELARPGKETAKAQALFERANLADVYEQMNAPVPTPEALQHLGPGRTLRLQEALERGEQAPLPMGEPSPELRQERLQQLNPTTLAAAGLKEASARAEAQRPKPDPQSRGQLMKIKETALQDLRNYSPEDLAPEQRQFLAQSIATAETPDDLFKAVADIPPGAIKPKSARIEEYQFYAKYELGQGRKPLGPLEWEQVQRKASATRMSNVTNVGPSGIDYGDPPKETTWARNSDGSVLLEPYGEGGRLAPVAIPVKGGQAYLDIQDAIAKKEASQEQSRQAAGIVSDTINRALTTIDDSPLPVTGLIGSGLSNIPGTDAFNLRTQLDTVRANIGFEALQQMRQSSPTGGALGPVSDTENRLLQSVLGSLNQGQSKGEMVQNLGRIREIYLDVLHGVGRPNRQVQYLTQEDIATLHEAQKKTVSPGMGIPAPDPGALTPADLQRLSPEALDALERRMSGGQ